MTNEQERVLLVKKWMLHQMILFLRGNVCTDTIKTFLEKEDGAPVLLPISFSLNDMLKEKIRLGQVEDFKNTQIPGLDNVK